MATLIAFSDFDINTVDLYWYHAFAIDSALENNVNVTVNNVTYPDSFWVEGYDGFDDLELDFLGSGFAQDAFGNITAGTVNLVAEYDWNGGGYLWYAQGISVSAVAIYNAALTPSNADELAIIESALSGNDTIILSDFADRMSGFAGDDTITGGLGADILSGGTGNDTFVDTTAGFNGDTITDFTVGESIILSDASLSGFTVSLSGNTLTFTGGSLTLQGNFAGYQFSASAAANGGVQLTLQEAVINDAQNDFNGDGRSDILWRNTDGTIGNWLANADGGHAPNNASLATISSYWQVAATGDFNGDGRDDILWRGDGGEVGNWTADANGVFAFNADAGIVTVPNSWQIVGSGDFNGDGRDDILWRNSDGTIGDWLANASGGHGSNDASIATVSNYWHVAGIGDFNGDGRDDILWRGDGGEVGNWTANANGVFSFNSAAGITTVPNDWQIAGIGDFNGDGRDDILWRNSDGTIGDWLANAGGGHEPNNASLSAISNYWQVAAVGDFNGDGRDDILWRGDGGEVGNWTADANGVFAYNAAAGITTVPNAWHVEPDYYFA